MDTINDPNSKLEPRLTVKFAKIPRAERKAERMQQLAKKKEEEELALGVRTTASGLSVASAQTAPIEGEEPMSKAKRRKLKNRAKRRKKKERYSEERAREIQRILNDYHDPKGFGLGVGRAHTMP